MQTQRKIAIQPAATAVDGPGDNTSATVRTRRVEGKHRFARIRRRTRTVETFDPHMADPSPTPIELALSALGASQETIYRVFAKHLGVALHGVEVTVTGALDLRGLFMHEECAPPQFRTIALQIVLDSPAAPEDLQRLVDAVAARCPVLNLFHNGTAVSLSISHIDSHALQ